MDDTTVDRYLARIGADRPSAPTSAALRDLHRRHLETVPFENLSIHLNEPVVLTEEALTDKIVTRHRGGFCYELNGLFTALLEALGFAVKRLAASVHTDDGTLTPAFDHMALVVDLEDRYLADVGFSNRRYARTASRTGTGRISIVDTMLIETEDGKQTRTELAKEDLEEAYRHHFGFSPRNEHHSLW